MTPERSGGVSNSLYPCVSAFFLRKSKCWKNLKNLIFQNLYRYTAAGVPLGSSRGLFFRNPKLRKTHFSEKMPKHEKTQNFTIPLSFSSKEASLNFWGAQKRHKISAKCAQKGVRLKRCVPFLDRAPKEASRRPAEASGRPPEDLRKHSNFI